VSPAERAIVALTQVDTARSFGGVDDADMDTVRGEAIDALRAYVDSTYEPDSSAARLLLGLQLNVPGATWSAHHVAQVIAHEMMLARFAAAPPSRQAMRPPPMDDAETYVPDGEEHAPTSDTLPSGPMVPSAEDVALPEPERASGEMDCWGDDLPDVPAQAWPRAVEASA
jgi:hypothetical protein